MTEAIIKEGWLKKPGSVTGNWKRRYIVIRGNELGRYNVPPTLTNPGRCKEVFIVTRVVPREDFSFAVLDHRGRVHLFRATNQDEREDWIVALVRSSTLKRQSIIPFTERRRSRSDTENPQGLRGASTMREVSQRDRAMTVDVVWPPTSQDAYFHSQKPPELLAARMSTVAYRPSPERGPRLPQPVFAGPRFLTMSEPVKNDRTSIMSHQAYRTNSEHGQDRIIQPPLPSPTIYNSHNNTQTTSYPELHNFLSMKTQTQPMQRRSTAPDEIESQLVRERMLNFAKKDAGCVFPMTQEAILYNAVYGAPLTSK